MTARSNHHCYIPYCPSLLCYSGAQFSDNLYELASILNPTISYSFARSNAIPSMLAPKELHSDMT